MMTMSTEDANGCEYNLPLEELQEEGGKIYLGHWSYGHVNGSTGVLSVF